MPKLLSEFIALKRGLGLPRSAVEAQRMRLSPRSLFIFLTLLTLLLSACGAQAAAAPLAQNSPESLPIKASIQIVTSTPVGKFVGDAVPLALRKQVEGRNVRLDISTSPSEKLP